MTDVNFSASAVFDRKLIRAGGESVRFLVARLSASREDNRRPEDRPPLNVALVIDASGSMAGERLEAAKTAALGVVERLAERDRLTVVSFASDVRTHLDAVPVTAENAQRIANEISSLRPRDMTFLSGGWFAGAESAARIAEENPQMTPRVIILSDGHANAGIVDTEMLREHADQLRVRGVLTSAVGIGDGYDEQLLRSIAESGGGRLHDAELTSEISMVLLGELDDIFGTVVENTEVAISVPAGVQIEALGKTTVQRRGNSIVSQLGPIQNNVERIAVFKVTCPKTALNDELAFSMAATGCAVDDRSELAIDAIRIGLAAASDAANDSQVRDTEVAAMVIRAWSAQVVSTAAQMNRDGAFEAAKTYVSKELQHFRGYAEGLNRATEFIHELEILAQRVDQQFTPRAQKEMVLMSLMRVDTRVDHRGAGKASWLDRTQDVA